MADLGHIWLKNAKKQNKVDIKTPIGYCYGHFFIRSLFMFAITITRTIITITGTTIGGFGAG